LLSLDNNYPNLDVYGIASTSKGYNLTDFECDVESSSEFNINSRNGQSVNIKQTHISS